FFQAEDGIRDFHVTGVQTCALPIYGPSGRAAPALCSWYGTSPLLFGVARSRGGPAPAPPTARSAAAAGAPPCCRPAGAPRPAPEIGRASCRERVAVAVSEVCTVKRV